MRGRAGPDPDRPPNGLTGQQGNFVAGMDDVTLNLGYARLDLDRESRQGLPEIVYGPGKTVREIIGIATGLLVNSDGPVLVTRLDRSDAQGVLIKVSGGRYDDAGRLLVWRPSAASLGTAAIVTAGTADGPVAAEVEAVCAALGIATTPIRDVGVAGLHRLLAVIDMLRAADIVVVIAGMEGALASVVGGLVAAPVIAVPTSAGYGASFDGITALLAMHASCAAGVTVVNIDSGFSAALASYRLLRQIAAADQRGTVT